ncbi:MAG: hypothetical protein V1720_01005 [bacterium]
MNNKINFLFVVLLMYFSTNNILSQTMFLQNMPTDKVQFGFRFLHPSIKNLNDQAALAGVYQFSVNIPLGSNINLIAEAPFMHYEVGYDNRYSNSTRQETGLGNIFLGFQTRGANQAESASSMTFGLFIPSAEENVARYGLFTNYYEHMKYYQNSMGLYYNYAYHKKYENNLKLGFETGPNIFIPTSGNEDGIELILHYILTAGYSIDKFSVNTEFLGTAFMTGDFNNFSDRLLHSIAFGVAWKEETVTPQLFYMFYLKDGMRDVVNAVLGIKVTVSLERG